MPPELPNKPLAEALLEIRWAKSASPLQGWKDPAYPLFVGPLYAALKKSYGILEPLPAGQIPDELTPGMVKYRFRATPGGWPLVQVGPGVATVNFTESYTWERFSQATAEFVPALLGAYQLGNLYPKPQINRIMLRFVNAFPLDPAKENALEFVRTKLHTSIALPAEIVTDARVSDTPTTLDVRMSHPVSDPVGSASVRIVTGKRHGEPSLVWELAVVSADDAAPQNPEGINAWMNRSHDLIESWFFTLVDGDLLSIFEKAPNG